MGRRPDEGVAALTSARALWDWSADVYARPGVEGLLLTLQDRHGLSVNMLLWCLWCGAHFETPGDLIMRKAEDLSRRWTGAVTSPLRAARRGSSAPPVQTPDEETSALKTRIKQAELMAERIEQMALEWLANENLAGARDREGAVKRSRMALAGYVRLTGAVKTAGFSASLLEDLISLSFAPSESDGDCVR